jgi:hypothetical protein
MTLTDLASIGTFISALAVLISLIYLSQQIRQNTKHSQALIQQGRAARIADTALRLAELTSAPELGRCFDGSPDVSANEVRRFLYICRAIFISAEDSFFQGQQGLLDKAAFESFEASIKSGMGTPGMAAGWALTRDMYEPKFRSFVDEFAGDVTGSAEPDKRSLARWHAALSKQKAG